ncbi:MAG: hypothetical protein GX444_00135 [Myxococcales bacterium]|nr:hypothetical protein [Myxococcales bacterium]
MKAACPVCAAEYPIPDEKIQGKAKGLLVKCRKCATVFRAFADGRPSEAAVKPESAPAETPAPAAAPAPAEPAAPSPSQSIPATQAIPMPSLAGLEPAARETGMRKGVVRSTFIDQPLPRMSATESSVETEPTDDLPEAEAEPLSETRTETDTEPTSEPDIEAVAEPIPESEIEVIAEPIPEPVIEAVAEPIPEPEIEAAAEPIPEPEIEVIAEPIPEPVIEAVAEPIPEPETIPEVMATPIETPPPAVERPKMPELGDLLNLPLTFKEKSAPAEPAAPVMPSLSFDVKSVPPSQAAAPAMPSLSFEVKPAPPIEPEATPEPEPLPEVEPVAEEESLLEVEAEAVIAEPVSEMQTTAEAERLDAEFDHVIEEEPPNRYERAFNPLARKKKAKPRRPLDLDLASDLANLRRFGDWRKLAKIGGLIGVVLLVIGLIVFAFSAKKEIKQIEGNMAKRNEASQIAQDQNKERLSYDNKYQAALRLAEPGTAEALEKAVGSLDEALQVKPDFVPALATKALYLAYLAIERQKDDRVEPACQAAQKAFELAPQEASALRAKAACELASGKLEEADKSLHEALTVKEDDATEDAESNYLLALLYIQQKDQDKAIFSLNSAVAMNRLHFRALHLLADLYASEKDLKKALETEEKALALIPDHLEAKRRIEQYQSLLNGDLAQTGPVPGLPAETASDTDKKAQAKELLKKLDDAVRRGSQNEALGLTNELMKLGVYTGEIYLRKCQLMLNGGHYEAAIDACTTARNYSPDAYYFLGAAYEASGNEMLKKQNYQAYLNARPDGRYAAEVRSILGTK